MIGWTHAAAGVIIAEVVTSKESRIYAKLGAYAAGFIGALLPDLDSEHALIHKILGTKEFHILFGKHRTITHTIWAIGAIYAVITAVSNDVMILLIIVLAYASHLVLDSLTYSRIQPLYPIPYKVGAGVCKSGGEVDMTMGMTLWAVAIYLICKNSWYIRI